MSILRFLALGDKKLSPFNITHRFTHLFWLGDLNYRVELPTWVRGCPPGAGAARGHGGAATPPRGLDAVLLWNPSPLQSLCSHWVPTYLRRPAQFSVHMAGHWAAKEDVVCVGCPGLVHRGAVRRATWQTWPCSLRESRGFPGRGWTVLGAEPCGLRRHLGLSCTSLTRVWNLHFASPVGGREDGRN